MDDLLDVLGDRVMKNVPPIARFPLKRDQLWHKSGKISIHIKITITIQINQVLVINQNDILNIRIVITRCL